MHNRFVLLKSDRFPKIICGQVVANLAPQIESRIHRGESQDKIAANSDHSILIEDRTLLHCHSHLIDEPRVNDEARWRLVYIRDQKLAAAACGVKRFKVQEAKLDLVLALDRCGEHLI